MQVLQGPIHSALRGIYKDIILDASESRLESSLALEVNDLVSSLCPLAATCIISIQCNIYLIFQLIRLQDEVRAQPVEECDEVQLNWKDTCSNHPKRNVNRRRTMTHFWALVPKAPFHSRPRSYSHRKKREYFHTSIPKRYIQSHQIHIRLTPTPYVRYTSKRALINAIPTT